MPSEANKNTARGFLQGEIHNILVPGINALGSLESQVMDVIWNKGEAEVSDIYFLLREKDPKAGTREEIKYTTVLTVVGRLVKKNMLQQDKTNRAFSYKPTVSREEYAQTQSDKVIEWLTRQLGFEVINESLTRTGQAFGIEGYLPESPKKKSKSSSAS